MPPSSTAQKMVQRIHEDSDPSVIALLEVAKAMNGIAEAITHATTQREPVDQFYAGAGDRLDKLCHFLTKRGPWILASIPGVLMAVGAITPNAAKAIATIISGGLP